MSKYIFRIIAGLSSLIALTVGLTIIFASLYSPTDSNFILYAVGILLTWGSLLVGDLILNHSNIPKPKEVL